MNQQQKDAGSNMPKFINKDKKNRDQGISEKEQNTALNNNPRANENLSEKTDTTPDKNRTDQVGSEITDGEAG